MSASDFDLYRVLNDLTVITQQAWDAAAGFTEAAGRLRHDASRQACLAASQTRAGHGERAAEHVLRLGGEPPSAASGLSEAHRLWVGFAHLVTGDDRPILVECARAERHARRRYQAALTAGVLPQDLESELAGQMAELDGIIAVLDGSLVDAELDHRKERLREEIELARVLERRQGRHLDNG